MVEETVTKNYFKRALFSEYRALATAKKFLNSSHYLFGTVYNNISLTFRDLNQVEKSIFYLNKAIVNKEATLPENHPELGRGYYNVARLEKRLGNIESAFYFADKALNIQQLTFSPEHSFTMAIVELIEDLQSLRN